MQIPSFILEPAINLVLPLIVGGLTSFIYEKLQKAGAFVDAQRPQIKVFLVGALAFLLPLVQKVAPGFDATTIAEISKPEVQSLVMLAATQAMHVVLKRKK